MSTEPAERAENEARAENPAIPAATVVLARDGNEGVEVLMLRRNSEIAFGGMWVFPGGRVDDDDRLPGGDDQTWARIAAVREAREETGLVVDAESLRPFSRWVPPPVAPVRFATWFFLAPAPGGEVVVDEGEIHEHAWMAPATAIERRDAGEIELVPPTWVTLWWLRQFDSVDTALGSISEPDHFATRVGRLDGARVALWTGDVAYDAEPPDLHADGPRHRLVMADRWEYHRTA